MATPRLVTINDIIQGRLYIDPVSDGNLTIQRDYAYIGDTQADQDLLDLLGGQSFAAIIALANVPQNIKDALVEIDTWTNDQILDAEGMA